ncbi:MAG: arylesterase [Cardiobacteriaceae bacterium]|nr:arylesterase [Cardiobacteriaceae bacterium]
MVLKKYYNGVIYILIFSLVFLLSCGKNKANTYYPKLSNSATILALGDSLTEGYGASKGADYPAQLSEITGIRVVNGGVSGDTSEQALSRLSSLISDKPDLIILCIGGNDFLRKIPETETRRNISAIIEKSQQENIPIMMIAVPYISMSAAFGMLQEHKLYDELAQKYNIALLKGAWAEILANERLKSDQIHANDQGYRLFAEKVASFLKDNSII